LDDFTQKIRELIQAGNLRISEHGYDELSEDNISVRELVSGIAKTESIEEYPDYPKGPCVLLLHKDKFGNPVHVVWGIPRGYNEPAVLVTAYRPDPERWDRTYLKRRQL
jgi:hypothetical protein